MLDISVRRKNQVAICALVGLRS